MNRRNATFAAFATAAAPYEPWREGDEYRAAPRYYVAVKLGEGDWETTSYKTRREAEAALGPKFDVRAFHAAVLAQGSVPLPVRESRVRVWVAEAKAAESR